MKNTQKMLIIGIVILILIAAVSFMTGCNAEKEIKFEQLFNSISYFGDSSPNDIDELNANAVYIIDTQQQWGAFKERYLQGEPMPPIELLDDEKIIFIHTKWEDMDSGISYYAEAMSIKDNLIDITIKENGMIERIAGFPEDTWIHSILIYKVNDKNIDSDLEVNLIIEE